MNHYEQALECLEREAPEGNHVRAYTTSERHLMRTNLLREAQVEATLYVGEQLQMLSDLVGAGTKTTSGPDPGKEGAYAGTS